MGFEQKWVVTIPCGELVRSSMCTKRGSRAALDHICRRISMGRRENWGNVVSSDGRAVRS
jgi:hypothetical protein